MSTKVKYKAGIICLNRFAEEIRGDHRFWASSRLDLPPAEWGTVMGLGESLSDWEKFMVTDSTSETDVRTFTLQNIYTGKFVRVRGGDYRLIANSDTPDGDDVDGSGYFIIEGTDNQFTMKTSDTGKFVSTDEGKGCTLYADRNEAHEWEQFKLVRLP